MPRYFRTASHPSLVAIENLTDVSWRALGHGNYGLLMIVAICLGWAVIEQIGLPALRIGFTVALALALIAGVFIWRRRHQFFDLDPEVENDVPVVRHNREEVVLIVWSGMTLVLFSIVVQLWTA